MLGKFKPKSEFSRNVLTLMTGTTIAQAIPIAISPILTRIYAPEDFGVFALYMSIVSIFAVIATGRYEMAIMLPEKDEEVNSIVKLIFLMITIVSLMILLIVVLLNEQITNLFDNQDISNWLFFLPISIFLVGIYQVYNYLLIREKSFQRLSKNKVIASTTNASTQLAIGVSTGSSFGLLFGNILGYIVSIYFIIQSKVVSKYFKFNDAPLKKTAKKYEKFPRYDVPSVLVNVMANQLPLLVLGKFFGLGILGFYALMYKALMMPIGLLSNTVLDVFKQQATEDYNNYGNCKEIYVKTFKKLVFLGLIPFIFLGIFAPELFSFVFGEQWRVAGEFTQIMTPALFLKFVVNPLSYTFYIVQKQRVNLLGQIFLLLITIVALYFGIKSNSEYVILIYYTIAVSVYQILYLYLSYNYSKIGNKNDS